MDRYTVSAALNEFNNPGPPIRTLFESGSMKLEFYTPPGIDPQPVHDQDELYFIASGSGMFVNEGIEQLVEVGEVIFVPAGNKHNFYDFTDDFSTWVVFYGPVGGEK
jgi:mannose-6-phosphate isomerase-like protein (cupin superfamily)